MRAGRSPRPLVLRQALRLALRLACVGLVPLAAGCDVVLALILTPFFPGQPLPPPPDLECPLELAPPPDDPADPGADGADGGDSELPTTFTPALPALRPGCDPGTKVLHRLNRTELDHVFRDLTGLDLGLAGASFPPDDFGAGFDNNAAVLATSPLFVEKLEAAGSEVVRQALLRPGEEPVTLTLEAEYGLGNSGADTERGERVLAAGNDVIVQAILPNAAGIYAVRLRAGSEATGAEVELVVDGTSVLRVPVRVSEDGDDKQLFEVRVSLDAGPVHQVGARVPGDARGPVRVDFFEVEGPLTVTALGPAPPARRRIVTCDLEADAPPGQELSCLREIVAGFGKRAWRRPLDDEELDRFAAFAGALLAEGDSREEVLRSTLVAVLLSPHFLFRVELDPTSTAPTEPTDPGQSPPAHALSDHELATRLAFFLWSSIPDDRLLALADRGALQDPAVLEAETRRMLDSPRSRALVENFAGQWLFSRAVQSAAPDPIRFPDFDESLRAAVKCETELTFDRFLRDESLSMLDLVTLEETFVNERLAAHYGLPAPTATLPHGWGLVSTKDTGRSGVLTQAGILTVTSQPTRTSPTRRGRWVLENLLCIVPDPPPPGVEGLPEPPPGEETESVRARLEQHRADPVCASCHAMIDPFGFGLEHYDAVGRFRESDNGFAIDDSALYMDDPALPFAGARELGHIMHDDAQLPFCMTQKTMTYALGRGIDAGSGDDGAGGPGGTEVCNVEDVVARFAAGGYKMSDLIVAVVQSPAFRMRRPAVDEVTP